MNLISETILAIRYAVSLVIFTPYLLLLGATLLLMAALDRSDKLFESDEKNTMMRLKE